MAVVMALLLKYFIVEAYKIPTGSMQPTLIGDERSGIKDRILVDKLSYVLRDPTALGGRRLPLPPGSFQELREAHRRRRPRGAPHPARRPVAARRRLRALAGPTPSTLRAGVDLEAPRRRGARTRRPGSPWSGTRAGRSRAAPSGPRGAARRPSAAGCSRSWTATWTATTPPSPSTSPAATPARAATPSATCAWTGRSRCSRARVR